MWGRPSRAMPPDPAHEDECGRKAEAWPFVFDRGHATVENDAQRHENAGEIAKMAVEVDCRPFGP